VEWKNFRQLAHFLQCETQLKNSFKTIQVDSRKVVAGDLFWALKGEHLDGHQFLQEVASKGGVGAVVSHSYQGPDFGLHLFKVEDTLKALQECGRQFIELHKNVRVVAVTGSIGKTTTKDFIKILLSHKYRVWASPGNCNTKISLPLSILNHLQDGTEIVVQEMGMDMPGQITRLVNIIPPEVAVLTTVELVHAWNFDSLEEIACAKAEIFLNPKTKLGILDRNICNFTSISHLGSCQKQSFSTKNSEADYYLDSNQTIHCRLENKKFLIPPFSVPGKHNLHNFLAAALAARYFNMSWEEIFQIIPLLKLPERRLQFLTQNGISFLNDSYNACEVSIKSALETLPPANGGKKIAILGSIKELGKFSFDCHVRVGAFALNHVDEVYCLGEECQPICEIFKKAGKKAELFLDRAELVKHLKIILKPSDVVLLKGSLSTGVWKVLEELN